MWTFTFDAKRAPGCVPGCPFGDRERVARSVCIACASHVLKLIHNEDAAPIDVDWNRVKVALLSDHAIVPVVPAVPAAGDREMPPDVKFHKGHRIYYALCEEVNVKVAFRVKDLGDEAGFGAAVDVAGKLRVVPSVAAEEKPVCYLFDAK